jgi:methionine-R-sulfoxide reductase
MLRFAIALACMLSMANSVNSAESVTVVELKDGVLTAPTAQPKIVLSEAEWRQRLGAEAFAVLRASGTERPFCGGLLNNKKPGYYVCGGCGLPLFAAAAKFESGTGWPSFNREVYKGNVERISDRSHGMVRVEIRCARCGGHLGHVFDDGPPPTGERHCLNSAALTFVADSPKADQPAK